MYEWPLQSPCSFSSIGGWPKNKLLIKDKVSKEAPSTADLGLDLWKADPNDPSKLEIMGEKAWNSVMVNTFGWWWPHSCPTPHCLLIKSLSLQVVPDLEKFMQAIRDKMASIQDMTAFLQDDSLPPPRGRYEVHLSQMGIKTIHWLFFMPKPVQWSIAMREITKEVVWKPPLGWATGCNKSWHPWMDPTKPLPPSWLIWSWTYPIPNLRSSRSFLYAISQFDNLIYKQFTMLGLTTWNNCDGIYILLFDLCLYQHILVRTVVSPSLSSIAIFGSIEELLSLIN